MLENELKNLLAKTIADTTSIDTNIGKMSNVSTAYEPIKIKFNRSYFTTLKLLEDILAKQYKEERGAMFVNEALAKFCYLGQSFLNCFCIQATFYPENPNYNSFELSIFYLALVNLAKRYKFTTLVVALEKIYSEIFNSDDSNNIALIITNVDEFKKRFNSEIILFEQQFILHYNATIKSRTNYTTKLHINTRSVNYQQLLYRLVQTRLHSYQQQLLLKFMQFTNTNPILISQLTKKIINDFTKTAKPNDSENDKINKLTSACQQYEHVLDKNCPGIVFDDAITKGTIVALPNNYDAGKLSLHYINLTRIYLAEEKLSKVVGCIFEACIFSSENFKNTQFSHCYFINCDFSGCTLYGILNYCRFDQCNFKGAYFEWLNLNHCIIDKCNLNETQWYRVNLSSTQIIACSIQNAAIRFSNIHAEFLSSNLTQTLFEGTRIKLVTSLENNWTNVNLDDALYLSKLSATTLTFTDHLFANIENRLIELFGENTNYTNLLISSSDITIKLNQIIHDEEPIYLKNYGASFKNQLGWILCAVDRLTEYCESSKNEIMRFHLKKHITNFEILADTVKTATKLFRYRYLTLQDRCHFFNMSVKFKHDIFNNYQQYQDALCKRIPTLPNSFFADNERVLQDDDLDNRDAAKFKKRESLMEIQRLPEKLKKIEKTFSKLHRVAQQLEKLLSNSEGTIEMLRNAIELYRLNHGP